MNFRFLKFRLNAPDNGTIPVSLPIIKIGLNIWNTSGQIFSDSVSEGRTTSCIAKEFFRTTCVMNIKQGKFFGLEKPIDLDILDWINLDCAKFSENSQIIQPMQLAKKIVSTKLETFCEIKQTFHVQFHSIPLLQHKLEFFPLCKPINQSTLKVQFLPPNNCVWFTLRHLVFRHILSVIISTSNARYERN